MATIIASLRSGALAPETYVPVRNFQTYEVSTYGNVRRIGFSGPGPMVNQTKDKDGYSIATLENANGVTQWRVHRLVAIHFVANPENKPIVDHIDRDVTNNH
eukprot:51763-Eustigmatos_ZCMA.PRE.1